MIRFSVSDSQWALMEPFCLGKKSDPGRSGMDNRMFVEGVLWKARTGCPWRDVPSEFGRWNTLFRRFDDWSIKGVFERMFLAVSGDPDMEFAMIDATIVPVHRHGHGAKGGLKIRQSVSQKADGQQKSSL
jgi:transposase